MFKVTPIIVITAAAMKEEEEIPRKISDAYLKKPVSKAQLVAELVRFLPHDEVEQDQAVTAPGVDRHWSPEELLEEQRAELPELQKLLADSVSIWQELSETLTINDIEIFASQMQGAGHRFGFVPLENWGERLATQAALFGMASLPVTLGEFQQVQQDLDTLIGA